MTDLLQRPHIVETESFSDTFGPKAQRKKPKLDLGSIEELGAATSAVPEAVEAEPSLVNLPAGVSGNVYADEPVPDMPTHANLVEPIYLKGTSRRIFGELYKVIDSSDIIVHVLDARDPLGTRCDSIIDFLKKEKSHKQIIFVLNKCDLIPTWATVSRIRSKFLFFLFSTPCTKSSTSAPQHQEKS